LEKTLTMRRLNTYRVEDSLMSRGMSFEALMQEGKNKL